MDRELKKVIGILLGFISVILSVFAVVHMISEQFNEVTLFILFGGSWFLLAISLVMLFQAKWM